MSEQCQPLIQLRNTSGVGIDTAYDYENEPDVGKGVAMSGKSRKSVFIETKVCTLTSVPLPVQLFKTGFDLSLSTLVPLLTQSCCWVGPCCATKDPM